MSEQQKICCICLEQEKAWEGSTKTKCGHDMCMPCFVKIVSQNANYVKCPLCRRSLPNVGFNFTQVGDEPPRLEVPWRDTVEEERFRIQRVRAQHFIESRMRRTGYLTAKKESWEEHCMFCKDKVCQETHERRTRWLEKGRLVPCPIPLQKENKTVFHLIQDGQILRSSCLYRRATALLGRELSTIEILSRRKGLECAIQRQKDVANTNKQVRVDTAGSIVCRLGTTLSMAIMDNHDDLQKRMSNPGVKVFKGFTPPKRGARTGDYWMNSGKIFICSGYYLWTNLYDNSHRIILQGKKWCFTVLD